MWRKKLDISMLRDAGDAQVESLAPSDEYLEELRDARWDYLPTDSAKIENLNRRVRRLEKPDRGLEARAKKAAKAIGALAVAAAALMHPIETLVKNYQRHAEMTPDQRKGTPYASTALDRAAPPDAGSLR